MAAQEKAPEGVKLIAQHRRARFDYHVEDTVEAGLQLMGSEVKSLREGTANLADAYAVPKGADLILVRSARRDRQPGGRIRRAQGRGPDPGQCAHQRLWTGEGVRS